MLVLAVMGSVVYAPTIAVAWAMYADAADYSEWQTGRRFTGMVFATIGFSLKAGLALGSAIFLWLIPSCPPRPTQSKATSFPPASLSACSSPAAPCRSPSAS
jgi:Na+/melibiose symporter-like transporter